MAVPIIWRRFRGHFGISAPRMTDSLQFVLPQHDPVPEPIAGESMISRAVKVASPSLAQQSFQVGTASFGPALSSPGITAQVGQVIDTAGNVGLACNPNDSTAPATLSPANAAAVNGKIALVDRGTCGFVIKVKACQDAGSTTRRCRAAYRCRCQCADRRCVD